MADTIKSFIDAVHDRIASNTSDPLRAESPYYVYGHKEFYRNSDRPPQVRYRLTNFELSPSNVNGTFCREGDIATWEQEIECSVWGSTEEETLTEAINVIGAIHEVSSFRGYPLPQGGLWVSQDEAGEKRNGELITFTFTLPISITQTLLTTGVQILSATFTTKTTPHSTGTLADAQNWFNVSGSNWVSGTILR